MVFLNRQSGRPGRILLTPENGIEAFYATMERADEPVDEGTPLNANTFNTLMNELKTPVLEAKLL